ncbi:MAG: DUF4340 domain-containing protein [Thiotrichaceae bacterium]|nr:DUF4340 domain-containing protein [Thiotrichaceae bacterium]PCI14813.1 MAG: hypothetical protein COB71_01800 [Thiotrichales bacterium]
MGTRWLLNLLLFAVVVGLAALAYLRPGLDEPLPPATISQLLPEQAQRVQIERPGREPISLVRRENGWQLTAPISLPANPFRIEPLLQLLRAQSHSSFPAVENALSQYELLSPQVWLLIDGQRYAFGGVEPLNGYRYVMVDEAVHLLSDRVQHYLLMSPYDFVALALLPAQSELAAVHFNRQIINDELTLAAWGEAHARRVTRYEVADGDAEPLTLTLSDGVTVQFDILLREPEFIIGVAERGVRYHFTEEEGEHLLAMLLADDA